MNLYERIAVLAHDAPKKEALLVCDEKGTVINTLSREALLTKIEEAASHLQRLGLRAGDRIALDLGNCADLLILSWAAWSSGIVTVPLDQKRDTEELRTFKIAVSGARKIIKQEEWTAPTGPVLWMPDYSHEALVLFTSGTTARPKGARLTLENLLVNAQAIAEWIRISEDDRFLVQLPLHHINSTTFCLASLLAGASIAIPPQYSNSRFWEQAVNTGATLTSLVPSIVFDQLSQKSAFERVKKGLKLNRIQIGSAPVVASAVERFIKTFSIPLYQGYGQTETALRVTGMPMDLSEMEFEYLVAENSIGTPMPWADLQIMDSSGRVQREGAEGELAVKGGAVMQGYLGGENAFRNGYFLTGDIGYYKLIGGRRFFFLKGRSKELVIKGGINISPVAVENALAHISPNVDQVYIVGVDDARYGEELGAVVVWKNGVDTRRAMQGLKFTLLVGTPLLSRYETPAYLTSLTANELPTTSTGKIQRMLLKNQMSGRFETIYELYKTTTHSFRALTPQSPQAAASHALYNHCWQPLTLNEASYKKYLAEYLTLAALDRQGQLVGQISLSCTDNAITCISICSSSFRPKPVPPIEQAPSFETVKNYLLRGHDPVMNFHQRLGAKLVELIPNGRPEDKSSLGYTVLLHYPALTAATINEEAPVSNQLIEVVRLLADEISAEVYALSRPGGLAAYFSKRGVKN